MNGESGSDVRSKRTRWALVAGIIVFSLAAFWLTTLFETVPPILKRGMQPSDFPQLVAGLMIGLAVLMGIINRDTPPELMQRPTYHTLVLMLAFVLVMQVDFFLGLALFAVSMAVVWGERRPPFLAIVGLAVPAAVFFLFDLVFRIRFPRGLLTSLWYG